MFVRDRAKCGHCSLFWARSFPQILQNGLDIPSSSGFHFRIIFRPVWQTTINRERIFSAVAISIPINCDSVFVSLFFVKSSLVSFVSLLIPLLSHNAITTTPRPLWCINTLSPGESLGKTVACSLQFFALSPAKAMRKSYQRSQVLNSFLASLSVLILQYFIIVLLSEIMQQPWPPQFKPGP